MTPTYLNSSPSPFPADQLNEDQHHQLIFTTSNLQASSLSYHINFFNSTQDQSGYYHDREIQHQQEVNNLASHGGSYNDLENENDHSGLKLSLWKKEDGNNYYENRSQNNSVKWMSSKMRLMQKMKNSDQKAGTIPTITTQKQQSSSPHVETDNSSNSSPNNSNIPVRVCSDCNTTKTPLWRSGPSGPKSLCNACGIRQRKARRAMAAAAANGGTAVASDETSSMNKAKVLQKRSNINGHVATFKKRSKLAATSSPAGRKKLCFEDFLISLSNNLAFHQVFPQDEKEAAILLMALSCGLVHG